MFDPIFLLVSAPLLVVLTLVFLFPLRKRPGSKQPPAPPTVDKHYYDPKAGLMIVTGRENPTVAIPEMSAADRRIVDDYLRLGKDLGLAISYFPHGASVNEAFLNEFIEAEQRYVALGYRTISLHAFEGLGGWNQPLPENEQPCIRREPGEDANLVGPPTMKRLKELGRLY